MTPYEGIGGINFVLNKIVLVLSNSLPLATPYNRNFEGSPMLIPYQYRSILNLYISSTRRDAIFSSTEVATFLLLVENDSYKIDDPAFFSQHNISVIKNIQLLVQNYNVCICQKTLLKCLGFLDISCLNFNSFPFVLNKILGFDLFLLEVFVE